MIILKERTHECSKIIGAALERHGAVFCCDLNVILAVFQELILVKPYTEAGFLRDID